MCEKENRFMYIKSDELSELETYTKILINKGIFSLYKNHNNYFLKLDDNEYLRLNQEGSVLEKLESFNRTSDDESVFFNDIAQETIGIQLNL